MTMRFANSIKMHAQAMDAQAPVGRWGTVTGAQGAMVKVLIQPEGVQTDWLPLLSAMVGGGWGLMHVPPNGTQVFIMPDAGDHENYVVVGATWSAQNQPPGAQQGEAWLQHSTGSLVKLTNDGKVTVKDAGGCSLTFNNNGTATLVGTLQVTEDIIDKDGVHGSVRTLRDAYNAHHHTGVQAGPSTTNITDHLVP